MDSNFKKYRKKADATVTAVQLDLEFEGFSYTKWGGEQRCRRGDWLVNNGKSTYTIEKEAFAGTYECVGPGEYRKSAIVHARPAEASGKVKTREGETTYKAGDYIVLNRGDESDSYAVSKEDFEADYEIVE